jgi:hypothetical protein
VLLSAREWVKAGVAAAVLLGLLALVALGSRGSHPGAHYHAHQRQIPAAVGNDLLTLVIVVYAMGLVVLIAAFLMFRHEWIEPRSRWLRDLVVTLVACSFLVLVLYRVVHVHARHGGGGSHGYGLTGVGGTQTSGKLPQLPAPKQSAHFNWEFAVALVGLTLLTAAFFLLRREPERPRSEAPVEEELTLAVEESIDDLRRERDPRRAVIAAYARMERVLRRHGRARRAAEAPYEYLTRILSDLRVRPEAVADLTELFERAKFSIHEIDAGMKAQAIAALVAVRDDLDET